MGMGAFLGRSAAGAALGAWMGGDQGQSRLGGAIGGAAMGGFGVWAGRRALNHFGGISGIARKQMGWLGRRAAWGERKLGLGAMVEDMGMGMSVKTPMSGPLSRTASYGTSGLRGVRQGLASGRQWVGNNALAVNKYGGYAAAAIGMASAAHIGSCAMGSNNGY